VIRENAMAARAMPDLGTIYRAVRDLAITGTALFLLVMEVQHEARTEVLLFIGSILGVTPYLRSSKAIRSAANGTDQK
jgi:hypothetical protein